MAKNLPTVFDDSAPSGLVDVGFVVTGADADAPNARVLTGTANQVVVTDDGVGTTVTLSLPQDLDTAADLQVAALGAGTAAVSTAALTTGAGFTSLIDASANATGESDIVIGDNLADALTVREGANAYITLDTSDAAEQINFYKELRVQNASILVNDQYTALTILDATRSAFSIGIATSPMKMIDFDSRNGGEIVTFNSHAAHGIGAGIELSTPAATVSVNYDNAHFQRVAPSVSIAYKLPVPRAGAWFVIANWAAGAFNLTVQNHQGTAIDGGTVLNQNEKATFVSDGEFAEGGVWQHMGIVTFSQS